jgi:hypothetical protein
MQQREYFSTSFRACLETLYIHASTPVPISSP